MSSYTTSSSSSHSKTSTSSGTRQSNPKNFEAAFGELSSSYGFGSTSRASSIPQQPYKAPQTYVAPTNNSFSPSLSRSSSIVPLLEKEKDSTSFTKPSSPAFTVDLTCRTAPKAPAPRGSAPKDYEAAFGAMSSSYGFAGAVPSLHSTHSTRAPKAPTNQQQTGAVPSAASGAPAKDYEAAYGALVSQNGWGSSALPSTASQGARFTVA